MARDEILGQAARDRPRADGMLAPMVPVGGRLPMSGLFGLHGPPADREASSFAQRERGGAGRLRPAALTVAPRL